MAKPKRMAGYEDVDTTFTSSNERNSSADMDVMCLEQVDWYHGTLSRNSAETVLMQHGIEGSYLMRKSKRHAGYSVSVKSQGSVKHFVLNYDNQRHVYEFGNAKFSSLKELLDHFESCPILSSENGLAVTLRHPYSVNCDEPGFYEKPEGHAVLNKNFTGAQKVKPESISSKSGYLSKRGYYHKNWKERWFTVERRFLKYFNNKGAEKPLKELDISLASSVSESAIDNKQNCFQLDLPNRTFYFCATSPPEAKEWIEFFQWKINYYRDMDL